MTPCVTRPVGLSIGFGSNRHAPEKNILITRIPNNTTANSEGNKRQHSDPTRAQIRISCAPNSVFVLTLCLRPQKARIRHACLRDEILVLIRVSTTISHTIRAAYLQSRWRSHSDPPTLQYYMLLHHYDCITAAS